MMTKGASLNNGPDSPGVIEMPIRNECWIEFNEGQNLRQL